MPHDRGIEAEPVIDLADRGGARRRVATTAITLNAARCSTRARTRPGLGATMATMPMTYAPRGG